MSKIIKLLEAKLTGDQRAGQQLAMNYTGYNIEYNNGISSDRDYQISVYARFGAKGWVSNRDYLKDGDLTHNYVVRDIKRGLVEEVFGEFRPYLMDIRRALYEHNFELVREKLNELETEMYKVD
jgi:hypothetical protein